MAPANPQHYPLLESLDLPADLEDLDQETLADLAAEIRSCMLDVISQTGGHLSPNLGVVELAMAIHTVFDSPTDRIIWDVGHQAYAHKLLTGRVGEFPTLRQQFGMSGYPSQAESEHDLVENSHASTSLSYAAGLALAREEGDGSYIVAVIGDGALTGGMAYEALNHIAHIQPERFIIVINDNGRSYAPTVGGLAAHLAALRVNPKYERSKEVLGEFARKIPVVGDSTDEALHRIKEAIKQVLQPATFLDVLGIKYTGPIDGHDLEVLRATLERAKQFHEPIVVHAVTEKGRGYGPAMGDDSERLHGVGAFDLETGLAISRQIGFTDAAEAIIASIADEHPEVVAITAAMGSATGLSQMAESYPERVIDVGLAEQHAVTLATGLAMGGRRPIVCIYSTFLQRAFDQLLMDVALHNQPVVFMIDRAGVTGPDGPSHHGAFDLAYLRMIPGLSIAAPSTAEELGGMLEAALAHPGPVAIRYPKAGVDAIPSPPYEPIPVGEWQELRSGTDVLLLAVGRMVPIASKAAVLLEESGISCGLVNARWVKPLDPRLADWAEGYDRVVTIEDGVVSGGFGAAVLERLAPLGMGGKVRTLGLPDEFLPHGNADALLSERGLDAEGIAAAVLDGR
ncbi:MAG TPA: 1-deoxy-D-xylulose-5-phosphate synthase [Acidimicrobiia bacterium]|nr:1-deoxy-D-xylulose-5-phosphate synthase [Acidimicrobiia bacterium]